MSLATKYRPKTFEDVTEQTVVIEMIKNMCEAETLSNRNFLLIGPAGTGKAQPLYSKVLTPTGFITMKDVQIGTEVITHKGNIGKVSGIYPQGVRPIYRITLQDKTYIDVSDEHLNIFYRYNQDTKQREDYCMSTIEMLELFSTSRFKLRIDTPSIKSFYQSSQLQLDPYLLGALLGDGSLSNNFQFSNSEFDIVEKVDKLLKDSWNKTLRKSKHTEVDYDIVDINPSKYKYTFTYKSTVYNSIDSIQSTLVKDGYPKFDSATIINMCKNNAPIIFKKYPELRDSITMSIDENYKNWIDGDPLHNVLRSMNLLCKSIDKHIPHEYLVADYDDRLRLLQGLFDTDGYIDTGGSVSFTTCSSQLSKDFEFLVRSLGIRDTVTIHPAKYKQNNNWIYTGTNAYEHNLKIDNRLPFFTSIKHTERYKDRQHSPIRNIVSIDYIGDDECQCIMVDHEDHTYISDGFIPTHNTTTARIIANALNNNIGEPIELDAASNGSIETVREIVSQARSYPVGTKYKVFIIDEVHSFSQAAWQVFLKAFEEAPGKSIFICCTTNPEKIPATIISRVQVFQLSKISLNGIYKRLEYIIQEENKEGRNITYTKDALLFIAKLAQGGMRDSITLLEKALTYSTDITSEMLTKALNLPNYDDYFALLNAYAKKDNTQITKILNDVYNSGVNYIKWMEGFHSFVMNVVKYIFMQNIEDTMIPAHYLDKISKYTTAHSTVCLKLANKLVKLNQELKTTQYLQEVSLTYLCSIPTKK